MATMSAKILMMMMRVMVKVAVVMHVLPLERIGLQTHAGLGMAGGPVAAAAFQACTQ